MAESSVPLQGVRVLVVDDHQDSADLLLLLLEDCGATVKVCSSGADALTTYSQWQPDVLISDILMPQGNGYRLIEQIRVLQVAHKKYVLAIALSGNVGEEDKQQAFDAGFDYFLEKPLNLNALIELLVGLRSPVDTEESLDVESIIRPVD